MSMYCMARRVLMAKVSGRRVRSRPKSDWMEGVKMALHGQRRDDCGGCATVRERYEGVESHSAFVDYRVSCRHYCLSLRSFGHDSFTIHDNYVRYPRHKIFMSRMSDMQYSCLVSTIHIFNV